MVNVVATETETITTVENFMEMGGERRFRLGGIDPKRIFKEIYGESWDEWKEDKKKKWGDKNWEEYNVTDDMYTIEEMLKFEKGYYGVEKSSNCWVITKYILVR